MRAAFFDLDKTIIVKPSIVALGPELHARGLIHRGTLIRAVFGQFMFSQYGADQSKMEKFRRSVLKMVKGWDRDEVREIVRSTLTEILEPLIYKEAADLIVHHQQLGDEVWIVSSSPEEVVEPFADLLHINGVIASRAEVDSNNKYTGELEFYAQGPSKAVASPTSGPGPSFNSRNPSRFETDVLQERRTYSAWWWLVPSRCSAGSACDVGLRASEGRERPCRTTGDATYSWRALQSDEFAHG